MIFSIEKLTQHNQALLPHMQQAFDVIGKVIPNYNGREWTLTEVLADFTVSKTYPDDIYDSAEYVENENQAAYVAIVDEKCVGSIRVCRRWNGNAFIEDLSVDRAYRHCGIGKALMDAAFEWSREKGLQGVSLETQDNNVLAIRFYLKYGFHLGGIDTNVYTDPNCIGETAFYFYADNKL